MNDEKYMAMAIELALSGRGWTSPNPMVGAVIVKNGKVIGKGWHEKYGQLHAERNALTDCSESPEGAEIYVTLEPCCHHGKQPPCTDALIEAGIKRVVVGSGDPNPLVAGKGIEILKSHGIEVAEGILRDECEKINKVFFHYIQTGTPYVTMKYAMTLDGKIAAYTGESKWVTGEKAREHVQLQRHINSGIMVGVGTVLADDPLLTCRMSGGKNPVRIICDSQLRTPLTSQIVKTAGEISTILATCCCDETAHQPYVKAGCRILTVGQKNGRVDLTELMKRLGSEKIDSILLEGGGTLNWSAVESGIVQKVQTYIASKVFGGSSAKTPVEGQGFPSPAESVKIINSTIIRLGDDFLIEGEVDKEAK